MKVNCVDVGLVLLARGVSSMRSPFSWSRKRSVRSLSACAMALEIMPVFSGSAMARKKLAREPGCEWDKLYLRHKKDEKGEEIASAILQRNERFICKSQSRLNDVPSLQPQLNKQLANSSSSRHRCTNERAFSIRVRLLG